MGKKLNNWPYLDAISPTDFLFDTKVQPNKAQSMTQVLMTLTEGHRSRSKYHKNGGKI